MKPIIKIFFWIICSFQMTVVRSLVFLKPSSKEKLKLVPSCSRRDAVLTSLRTTLSVLTPLVFTTHTVLAVAAPNGLQLKETPSGLKWADAKIGSGKPFRMGSGVAIDYSMASTAGRFPQIYSTKDKSNPYRWKLGDNSTILGIEMAILGDESIPPMLPGGIRRVIIPSKLGYQGSNDGRMCGTAGPIPPKDEDNGGPYQRWVQFYCNPRIPYQPDIVLDIKLYGNRT